MSQLYLMWLVNPNSTEKYITTSKGVLWWGKKDCFEEPAKGAERFVAISLLEIDTITTLLTSNKKFNKGARMRNI